MPAGNATIAIPNTEETIVMTRPIVETGKVTAPASLLKRTLLRGLMLKQWTSEDFIHTADELAESILYLAPAVISGFKPDRPVTSAEQ